MHAALFLTGTLQSGKAARTAALILIERARYSELARTAMILARIGRSSALVLFLLLGFGALRLRSFDRSKAARRRRGIASGRSIGLFGSRLCKLLTSHRLIGRRRLCRAQLDRIFLSALFFGAATIFFLTLSRFELFALARFLALPQPLLLGFKLEPLNTFLRRFARRDRAARRRLRRRWRRRRRNRLWRGRRGGDFKLGRFARFDELAAALHLNRNLVGAAVAESLLDLASFDRTFQAQRLAGALVVIVAHYRNHVLQISINSPLVRRRANH
jgi:hypothetical protein